MDGRAEREKMVAGSPYEPREPGLVAARAEARRLARAFSEIDPAAFAEQHALLSRLFAGVGERVVVEAPFHIDYGWNITLGDDVYINAFCVLLDCAPITIGAARRSGRAPSSARPLTPPTQRSAAAMWSTRCPSPSARTSG